MFQNHGQFSLPSRVIILFRPNFLKFSFQDVNSTAFGSIKLYINNISLPNGTSHKVLGIGTQKKHKPFRHQQNIKTIRQQQNHKSNTHQQYPNSNSSPNVILFPSKISPEEKMYTTVSTMNRGQNENAKRKLLSITNPKKKSNHNHKNKFYQQNIKSEMNSDHKKSNGNKDLDLMKHAIENSGYNLEVNEKPGHQNKDIEVESLTPTKVNHLQNAMEQSGPLGHGDQSHIIKSEQVEKVAEEDVHFTEESIEDGNEYGQLEKKVVSSFVSSKQNKENGNPKVEPPAPTEKALDLMKHAIENSGSNLELNGKAGHHNKDIKVDSPAPTKVNHLNNTMKQSETHLNGQGNNSKLHREDSVNNIKSKQVDEEDIHFTEESMEDGNEYGQLEKKQNSEDGKKNGKLQAEPPAVTKVDHLRNAMEQSGPLVNLKGHHKTFGGNSIHEVNSKQDDKVSKKDVKFTEESIEDGNDYGEPFISSKEEAEPQVEYIPNNHKQFQAIFSRDHLKQPSSEPTQYDQQPSSESTQYHQQPSSEPTPHNQQPSSDPTSHNQQPLSEPTSHNQQNQKNVGDKDNSCTCGKTNSGVDYSLFEENERVIGGTEAVANSFPWIVRIVHGCAGKI